MNFLCIDLARKERLVEREFGDSLVPMDGSLVRAAIDISGRPSLHIHKKALRSMSAVLDKLTVLDKGGYSFIAAEQFISAFIMNAGINTHIEILSFDRDIHHLIEAIFKAMGRALDKATQIDPRIQGVPSTKGRL